MCFKYIIKKTMPEENLNPTWVAQTSQTSQWSWSQPWDDFVIDFWEWGVVDQQTESNIDDNQNNMDDFSQWDDLANQDNEVTEEWNQDDILFDDDLFGWSEADTEDTNQEDDFLWEDLSIQSGEDGGIDEIFPDGAEMGLTQDDASLDENNEIADDSNSESELLEEEEQEPSDFSIEQEQDIDNPVSDNESNDELRSDDEISASDEESDTLLSGWNEDDGVVEGSDKLAEDDEYSNPFENMDIDAPLEDGENFESDLSDDAQFDNEFDQNSDFEPNTESDVESENMDKESDEMIDQNLYENDIEDSNYIQEESDINENENTDFMENINLNDDINSEIVENSEESMGESIGDSFPSEEADFDENRFENTENSSGDNAEDNYENNYDNEPAQEEFMQNEEYTDSVNWDLLNSESDNQINENSNIQSEVENYWNVSSEDLNDEPQISDSKRSEEESLTIDWLEQAMDVQWDQNVNNESDLDSQSPVSVEPESNDQSEPTFSYEMSADLINQNEENADTNAAETTPPLSIPETTDSVENVSEWQAVQSVLSLDQILDSELQMNGQSMTTTPSKWENSTSSKWSILPIAIWAGVLALAAVVVLMAFPTLLSEWGNVSWEESVPTHWSAEGIIWEQTVIEDVIQEYNPTDIETGEVATSEDEYEPYFPTPIGSEEDTNLGGDEIDYQYQPAWNINTPAKPYSAGNVEYFDEESADDEMISEDEILSVISSFKSQGEQYYKSGQERVDREIIIYASKIIYLCDEYNSRVLAKEWLDMESFENFNTSVQDVIKKINSVYNANDTDTTLVQNDFNPEDTNFDWKDQIRDYIQNR